MNKQPLGCLSISGIFASIITLVVIIGFYFTFGGTLFSPGDLNAQTGEQILGGVYSHGETNGQCSLCHSSPWSSESMAQRCVTCHTDIIDQLRNPQSLHGYVLDEDNLIICRDCHMEHQGSAASLTFFGDGVFPHEVTSYSLQGHQWMADQSAFECIDCHRDSFINFNLIACTDCHLELEPTYLNTHSEIFGTACLDCHDGIDTYTRAFNHDRAPFPLDGEHANLGCGDCHIGAASMLALETTPQDCLSCHREDDIHTGQLGENCDACHNPEGWEQADLDHFQTNFPLEGRHVSVDCMQCHSENQYRGTPQSCVECHQEQDIHNANFGLHCAACHTADGWEYAVFDHSTGNTNNCISCHSPDTPANHFAGQCSACHNTTTWQGAAIDHNLAGFTNCISCHTPETPVNHFEGQCSDCHSTNTWGGATFNHTFPLKHENSNGECSNCHPSNASPAYSTYTCYNCHEHDASKVEREHREEGITNYQDCMECHPTGREDDD
ncbi:MAG: hypothetical protein FVQ83_01400 [Chloroflexi bacterium]|nr:hypothetical protein [Chloroflexota bacterium]